MVLTASEHQTIFLFKNKANFNMMTPASGKWQSNSSLDIGSVSFVHSSKWLKPKLIDLWKQSNSHLVQTTYFGGQAVLITDYLCYLVPHSSLEWATLCS